MEKYSDASTTKTTVLFQTFFCGVSLITLVEQSSWSFYLRHVPVFHFLIVGGTSMSVMKYGCIVAPATIEKNGTHAATHPNSTRKLVNSRRLLTSHRCMCRPHASFHRWHTRTPGKFCKRTEHFQHSKTYEGMNTKVNTKRNCRPSSIVVRRWSKKRKRTLHPGIHTFPVAFSSSLLCEPHYSVCLQISTPPAPNQFCGLGCKSTKVTATAFNKKFLNEINWKMPTHKIRTVQPFLDAKFCCWHWIWKGQNDIHAKHIGRRKWKATSTDTANSLPLLADSIERRFFRHAPTVRVQTVLKTATELKVELCFDFTLLSKKSILVVFSKSTLQSLRLRIVTSVVSGLTNVSNKDGFIDFKISPTCKINPHSDYDAFDRSLMKQEFNCCCFSGRNWGLFGMGTHFVWVTACFHAVFFLEIFSRMYSKMKHTQIRIDFDFSCTYHTHAHIPHARTKNLSLLSHPDRVLFWKTRNEQCSFAGINFQSPVAARLQSSEQPMKVRFLLNTQEKTTFQNLAGLDIPQKQSRYQQKCSLKWPLDNVAYLGDLLCEAPVI